MLIKELAELAPLPKCPFFQSESGVKLTNFTSGRKITDVLHAHSKPIACSEASCKGSMMSGQSEAPGFRTKTEVLDEAEQFQEQYLDFKKMLTPADLENRMNQIRQEVSNTGIYTLTLDELTFASKMAWRNAARCIGRIQWNKLHVLDYRNITTTKEMFEGLCKHLEYANNDGNIRSTITVFPPRIPGREDFRVWNPQLINFAGYLQPDGNIIGDPGRVQFTRVCQRLGWKGRGGRFDVLPFVLSAPGEGPKFYDIPEHLVLRVTIEHPKFEWFKDLGIVWYALPAVADMMLDAGGLCFTAAPFNGWYMATEIGARNLCDVQRYNITKEVADKMGLDTRTAISLWKDVVLVETTIAVLHSFQKNKITIVDHHTAADTFMKHMDNELNLRGGCPADWVWIVPPISGSITPVFHQEMINYNLKPSYEYQQKAYINYKWPSSDKIKLKFSFNLIAKVVVTCLGKLAKARKGRTQATILYASETGKSETFARKLANVLQISFNTKVLCMEEYDTKQIKSEDFVSIVTSTFGSGEPPDNGKSFWKSVKALEPRSLKNLKYAVFALGSTQYPNFCNFGKDVDGLFAELGGHRIFPVQLGDEMAGQEHTFNQWLSSIFQASCKEFRLELAVGKELPTIEMNTWKSGHFRLVPANETETNILQDLSKLHGKKLFTARLLSKTNLQAEKSERQTLIARLSAKNEVLSTYEPGDHVAIFPTNPPEVVEIILHKINQSGHIICGDVTTEFLKAEKWTRFERLPKASLDIYVTQYLDIVTPPSMNFLALLSQVAKDDIEREKLKTLSQTTKEYEEWKSFYYPNLAEVVKLFPSIELDPTLLISELPLLQPRYYSISSSRKVTPNEIHITFSMVTYRTQEDNGPLHHGVCTSFLKNNTYVKIPCFIRSAKRFRLPEDHTKSIIMVGSGSGIAPFRSFWQERDSLKTQNQAKPGLLGKMYLFFGCRRSDQDNIYQDETSVLVKRGVITKVFTAFSREPGKQKEYVQHRLQKESATVFDVLLSGGHIYVCGDAVMANDVRDTIDKILKTENQDINMTSLLDSGHYHEDIFGVTHKK